MGLKLVVTHPVNNEWMLPRPSITPRHQKRFAIIGGLAAPTCGGHHGIGPFPIQRPDNGPRAPPFITWTRECRACREDRLLAKKKKTGPPHHLNFFFFSIFLGPRWNKKDLLWRGKKKPGFQKRRAFRAILQRIDY